ncbi:MAG: DUF2911 domain-containing protein [Bacteroidetes bacterium]|nr:DUF2911 domain-containing protein [Bacteroidota bacterium]
MKRISFILTALMLVHFGFTACAQNSKPSPAQTATGKVGSTTVTVNYGSPSVKGRKIWGELVPYGKVWRAGANEATTIEFDADVKIEGQSLPKGKYALFTIPDEKEWTIIFNKNPKQWGAYSYKQEEDVLRVKVKSSASSSFNEALLYEIGSNGVTIKWENLQVPFSVK